jgi:DNA repair protein RecN (Recombination protein N)
MAALRTLPGVLPRLEQLRIRDVGVIDDVLLELAPGLNVLTGETGAGKTMVVSALELLRGIRADADRVRVGAGAAVVEGRIHPTPEAARDWAGDGDDDLVVAREVLAEPGGARSRARIGGRLAAVSALAEVMDALVEVHGQSDTVRLSAPAVQRDLLDRFGGAPVLAVRSGYDAAFRAWRSAVAELEELQRDDRSRARELDRLRFELTEIDEVAPEAGEDARVAGELARLEHAEALIEAAASATAALNADGGARDSLGLAVAGLRAVSSLDEELDALRGRAEGLAAEVQELGLELGAYTESLALDPARLEQLRERRAALAGLTRKYGPDLASVLEWADGTRAELTALEGGEERARALAADVDRLRVEVATAGESLREARAAAGARLASEIQSHLGELAMESATMEVQVRAAEPGPHGADSVTFALAANPGTPLLPLHKAASGGERSRVALAVRLALADVDATPVIVFDEVDAGIGGAVATQVGRKLARLARGRQVLCVTHLAQLAAFADAHFAVEKDTVQGAGAAAGTAAKVRRLEEPERIVELSRMLSGSPESALAAGHAGELRAAALADLSAAEAS